MRILESGKFRNREILERFVWSQRKKKVTLEKIADAALVSYYLVQKINQKQRIEERRNR